MVGKGQLIRPVVLYLTTGKATLSPRQVRITASRAPTINAALADLEHLGIVEEVTGRRRGRVFGDSGYLAILSEGTEPLPAISGRGETRQK